MQEIIRFAKDRMDMKEIKACIYVENQKSINLITKLGFKEKGTMNEVFRGEKYLHNIYSLAVKLPNLGHSINLFLKFFGGMNKGRE